MTTVQTDMNISHSTPLPLLTGNENWFTQLELVKAYITFDWSVNTRDDRDNLLKNPDVVEWLDTQSNKYNTHKLDANLLEKWVDFVRDIRYSWFVSKKVRDWMVTLSAVKEYTIENGRRPHKWSPDKCGKILGAWLEIQAADAHNTRCIMTQNRIRILWYDFANGRRYNEKWLSNTYHWKVRLNDAKAYIDKNTPNQSNYHFSKWIQIQLSNYENGAHTMHNPIVACLWEEFVNDSRYSEFVERAKLL
jgi:hypothetical protein